MDADLELQAYANTIEATLCLWDHKHEGRLTDGSALRVMEMLLDKYHFGDSDISTTEEPLREGFEMVVHAIGEDLEDVPDDTIVKILGVIYFVARRRTTGGREYLDMIHAFVGTRTGPGIRVFPNLMGSMLGKDG
jgi:hypothetical protein